MSVYRRKGQETYSYDFQHRGHRFSGSTGCTTKREAERWEAREKERVKKLTVTGNAPMTFIVAAARYWEEVGKHHRNHVDTLRSLDWLQEQLGKTTLLSSISDSEIASLVAKRRGEGVSNATVNRSVNEIMRGILRRAQKVWKQAVQDIDWKQHFLKEAQERIREATPEEEAKLVAAFRGDYAPAFRFAILSGCRRAEIVGLRWRDVDFFNRVITVKGKGDKIRTIPMTTALYELLKTEHGKHVEHVFTYTAKMPREDAGKIRPITMEGFKTEWRRARKRSGVENFRFHDSRHTAATRLVRKTGNLKLAQRLLGHSDLKTTSRYAHVSDDDLRAAMEASIPTENPTRRSRKGSNDLKQKKKVL